MVVILAGIHKLHTSGDEIVLDAETEWEGNPSCILSVGLPIGVSVPAQVGTCAFYFQQKLWLRGAGASSKCGLQLQKCC
jgi:hypothetical protein